VRYIDNATLNPQILITRYLGEIITNNTLRREMTV